MVTLSSQVQICDACLLQKHLFSRAHGKESHSLVAEIHQLKSTRVQKIDHFQLHQPLRMNKSVRIIRELITHRAGVAVPVQLENIYAKKCGQFSRNIKYFRCHTPFSTMDSLFPEQGEIASLLLFCLLCLSQDHMIRASLSYHHGNETDCLLWIDN